MARYLSVELDDGTTVLFEDREGFVGQRGGNDVKSVSPQLERLDNLAKAAAGLCTSLRSRLEPDELSLELGAVLSGEVGWFIAKSSLEASIKITVTWKKPSDEGAKAVIEQ